MRGINHALILLVAILAVINIFSLSSQYALIKDIGLLSQRIESLSHKTPYVIQTSPSGRVFYPVERSIPIVAVSSDGEGVMGNLTVKLIPGNNNVLINTNPFLDTDIQYSANKAVAVAKLMSDYSFDRDFLFDFKAGDARLIGGESAGAAITIATIAALQNKSLRNDAVITGTINSDGTIGRIGGVIEKARAVADAGYRYFLVPRGQAVFRYYERQVTKEPFGFGFEILNTRYVPRTIDLRDVAKKEWGLEIVEVSTIEEALPYFIDETS